MKLKVLSWDIEVLPFENKMPTADKCPVIMMSFAGNYDLVKGKRKVVLILDRRGVGERKEDREDYILGKFIDERRILEVFENLVKTSDVIVGFNINGFDFPYVIDRGRVLNYSFNVGMGDDRLWHKGRVSKGMKVVNVGGMKGRIIFDVLSLLRRIGEENVFKKEYNLKNLTLAWVSKEILGEEEAKLKFSVKDMIKWWETGDREEDFITYGLRDAEVVIEMVQKFRLLDMFIMLSRRSGKLIQDIIDSTGYGLMVENLLMKESRVENRVVPMRHKKEVGSDEDSDSDLEGAYVHEPKLGITDELASLDFKSMYPNIMVDNNICYSTLIEGNSLGEHIEIISEDGLVYGRYIKKEIYVGIIPKILSRLLEERALLKKDMKQKEFGSVEYISLNVKQNAAKILMNSFYGYTGDKTAKLYVWNVSSSVTGAGRKQIVETINQIETTVIDRQGKSYTMKVVIGDTDSCYIKVMGAHGREEIVGVVMDMIKKINKE